MAVNDLDVNDLVSEIQRRAKSVRNVFKKRKLRQLKGFDNFMKMAKGLQQACKQFQHLKRGY